VLTVKDNQEHFLADVQQSFVAACEANGAAIGKDTYETHACYHGSQDYRSYTVLHLSAGLRNAAARARGASLVSDSTPP
jgi:hypothetical protein